MGTILDVWSRSVGAFGCLCVIRFVYDCFFLLDNMVRLFIVLNLIISLKLYSKWWVSQCMYKTKKSIKYHDYKSVILWLFASLEKNIELGTSWLSLIFLQIQSILLVYCSEYV